MRRRCRCSLRRRTAAWPLGLARIVRAACVCCSTVPAAFHLPPATCSLQAALRFLCVFKFFINPKKSNNNNNNAGNYRLALPLTLTSTCLPAASALSATHTHTHTKYANNFQLKINFMLQLPPSGKCCCCCCCSTSSSEVATKCANIAVKFIATLATFLAFQ